MSIDRFGGASEAHRRAVARRMACVVSDVRQDTFAADDTSEAGHHNAATDVFVEWERLGIVRAPDEDPAIKESVRKDLIMYMQALNNMHALLDVAHDQMIELGNADEFNSTAEAAGLEHADAVISPHARMHEYTAKSLAEALAHNPAIAQLQLLAPDDTEEEVDEGGEVGDSDEESASGASGSGSGSDDDIRSESEEEDDASEEEEPEAKRGRSE